MNTGAGAGTGIVRCPPQASGWRLLSHRRQPAWLRWATDPDAPDQYQLAPGEVRLAIVGLDLSGGVWAATGRDRAHARRAGHLQDRDEGAWLTLFARGEACVVESSEPRCAPGTALQGMVPVSTHAVMAATEVNGRAQAPASSTRCREPLLQTLGIDEVEQRARLALAAGAALDPTDRQEPGRPRAQVGLWTLSGANRLPWPPNQNQRLLSPM